MPELGKKNQKHEECLLITKQSTVIAQQFKKTIFLRL